MVYAIVIFILSSLGMTLLRNSPTMWCKLVEAELESKEMFTLENVMKLNLLYLLVRYVEQITERCLIAQRKF